MITFSAIAHFVSRIEVLKSIRRDARGQVSGIGIGLRLFETVSIDNVASYRSALSASNVRVVKEMPKNELYLEITNET